MTMKEKPSKTQLPEWASDIFDAVDRNDVDRFLRYLADNASFGFDGTPMATGKTQIRTLVEGYLSGFDRLIHHFDEVVTQGNSTFIRGRVDYIIDGSGIANAGWAVCFHRSDDLVTDYLIYMDPTPLLRLQEKSAAAT